MAENLRSLRRKIRTVRSIEHITRAMQFVATARLARLEKRVAAGREYAQRLQELLRHISAAETEVTHPYLLTREVRQVLLVLMAGDRGLCGAFNQQIMRTAEEALRTAPAPVVVITVGAKATAYAKRRGLNVLATYPGISELGRSSPALGLAKAIRDLYDRGVVDQVVVAFEDFQSVLRHRPQLEQLLPIPPDPGRPAVVTAPYLYEPPPAELLQVLLPQAVDAILYQMALGTQTAEQAARMTAMSAATENARDMIAGLTRRLNRARQYSITAEMLDVVGGAAAIGAA